MPGFRPSDYYQFSRPKSPSTVSNEAMTKSVRDIIFKKKLAHVMKRMREDYFVSVCWFDVCPLVSSSTRSCGSVFCKIFPEGLVSKQETFE